MNDCGPAIVVVVLEQEEWSSSNRGLSLGGKEDDVDVDGCRQEECGEPQPHPASRTGAGQRAPPPLHTGGRSGAVEKQRLVSFPLSTLTNLQLQQWLATLCEFLGYVGFSSLALFNHVWSITDCRKGEGG